MTLNLSSMEREVSFPPTQGKTEVSKGYLSISDIKRIGEREDLEKYIDIDM